MDGDNKDKPKVVPMPKKEIGAASIEAFRRGMPNFLEHAGLVAQIKRRYYEELVKQGFTEKQALKLTRGSVRI